MKEIYLCLITFFSLISSLLIIPLRMLDWGGFKISSLVGYILCFSLTILCLKKFKDNLEIKYIFLAIILGQWILELPIRIIDFKASLISFPESIIRSLGIICGLCYWYFKNPFKTIVALLGISVTTFMYFQGWNYWIHYLNFGTFTGKVSAYNLPAKFEAFNESHNLTTENDFNNKIVLLDFWTTSCGVCFKKFPQLQAGYEKYKQDSFVMILAVDTPLEDDKPNQAFEMIKERNYTFPVVITKDAELAKKWGVIGYPTTFVMNQTGQIVYKGDIEGAIRMVDELKLDK